MNASRRTMLALTAMVFVVAACKTTDSTSPATQAEGIALLGKIGNTEVPAGIDAMNAAALLSGSALRMASSAEGFETVGATASLISGSGIISNGTVMLGVRTTGDLNVPSSIRSGGGTYTVGLRYVPTTNEATAAGCTCEGWGVGDRNTGFQGSANSAVGGVQNLVVENFVSTATEATSTVKAGNTFRVTHNYRPSVTPNLYEVEVTIENISSAPTDVVYRRVMDWDIEPTPFNEFVTIQRGTSTDLIRTDNNGFNPGNPFSFSSYGYLNVNVVDAGPSDHGALFDFGFGILAPGARKTFKTYYGAAGTEIAAKAALGAVGAEVYSFGQPNVSGGPNLGTPNTFIFAFGGVGGTPVEPPPVDNSPPVVTPVVNGTLGTNGWYTSDVNVSWTVSDGQSPITSAPCTASTLTTDTAGATYTCTATSQGGSSTGTVTIKRDASIPTVAAVVAGTEGTNGWYTSDVEISWTVTPNGPSSATSACVVSNLSSNTASQTYDCTATSGAGLTGSSSVTVTRDDSTPTITPTVTGTMGANGWFTSDVTVSWGVTANGPSGAVSGCAVSTQSADTNGVTVGCSATSGAGLSASNSVSLKRDATNPSIGYTGNAGTYTVDQNVSIICSASDAMSGLDSSTCANISGSAFSFGVGLHSYSASALDNAGNTSSASTSFTVVATSGSLCALVRQWVTGPGAAGVANSLCVKLEKGNYAPFINEVQALSGKKISTEHANILIAWAQTLL